MVDDGRLAQTDLDPGAAAVLLYRVSGEAVVQVVILSVPVQQSRLQLTFHYHCSVLHSGYVLFWDCTHTHTKTPTQINLQTQQHN